MVVAFSRRARSSAMPTLVDDAHLVPTKIDAKCSNLYRWMQFRQSIPARGLHDVAFLPHGCSTAHIPFQYGQLPLVAPRCHGCSCGRHLSEHFPRHGCSTQRPNADDEDVVAATMSGCHRLAGRSKDKIGRVPMKAAGGCAADTGEPVLQGTLWDLKDAGGRRSREKGKR